VDVLYGRKGVRWGKWGYPFYTKKEIGEGEVGKSLEFVDSYGEEAFSLERTHLLGKGA